LAFFAYGPEVDVLFDGVPTERGVLVGSRIEDSAEVGGERKARLPEFGT
jgi:hypothetical protein